MTILKIPKKKRPKTKTTRKKRRRKKKKDPTSLVQPPPSPVVLNEGAEEFYDIIAGIYKDADDSALAAAKFESDLVSYYVTEGEDGQEIPDEFKRGFFQETHGKLLELRALKDFAEAFKLGAYLPEIMSTRIRYLFGGNGRQSLIVRRPSTAFAGNDEEYLVHTLKEKMKNG